MELDNFPFDQKPIKYNKFDKEYYVMDVDYKHPMLNWGSTDDTGFGETEPIDATKLELPLQIVFDGSPKKYEMADFHLFGTYYACGEKLKKIFERQGIYGTQFIPVIIGHKKNGDIVKGYYAMHVWVILSAVDKENYEGEEVDRFGMINRLEKFSLDVRLLESIPLAKRLVFALHESSLVLIHKSIYEILKTECLTGIKYIRVDEWYNDWMLR